MAESKADAYRRTLCRPATVCPACVGMIAPSITADCIRGKCVMTEAETVPGCGPPSRPGQDFPPVETPKD